MTADLVLPLPESIEVVDRRGGGFEGRSVLSKFVPFDNSVPDERADFLCTEGLGTGAFGQVLKLVSPRDGRVVAAKICAYTNCRHPHLAVDAAENERRRAEDVAMLREEFTSLDDLQQGGARFIPEIFGFRLLNGREPAILMECLGANLGGLVENEHVHALSDASLVVAMEDMISALAEIHALGWAALDLKPENFCLTRDNRHGIAVKLVDFGMMERVDWAAVEEVDFAAPVFRPRIKGTLSYTPRAAFLQTALSPVDNFEALFYVAMRLAGEDINWWAAAGIPSFAMKRAFWKNGGAIRSPLLADCFAILRACPRHSPFAHSLLVEALRFVVREFGESVAPDTEPFPQLLHFH
ncbi:Protein kinase domain-containing protein [Aphelenchoides fujianensis]|nr:Protein kinase domain-containing protein [Aphelenchoides fujianensis]